MPKSPNFTQPQLPQRKCLGQTTDKQTNDSNDSNETTHELRFLKAWRPGGHSRWQKPDSLPVSRQAKLFPLQAPDDPLSSRLPSRWTSGKYFESSNLDEAPGVGRHIGIPHGGTMTVRTGTRHSMRERILQLLTWKKYVGANRANDEDLWSWISWGGVIRLPSILSANVKMWALLRHRTRAITS